MALTLVSKFASTAGICAPLSNCKILLALVPTSTVIVPVPVIVVGVKPVLATTEVSVPVVAVAGIHLEVVEFQVKTCAAVGILVPTS